MQGQDGLCLLSGRASALHTTSLRPAALGCDKGWNVGGKELILILLCVTHI